jgi:DNA-directed RNA polymerase subunit M/transcription elongation factor TFIIS
MIFGLKWPFGRKSSERDCPPRSKGEGLKVKCPSCGYEGEESEFLRDDPGDTTCPSCGEDIAIYEL